MANKIQYTIGLNVDDKTAKSTLSSLQRQLQSVANIRMKVLVDDADIKAASFAAQELQTHLNKAINQDTGKLDLTNTITEPIDKCDSSPVQKPTLPKAENTSQR